VEKCVSSLKAIIDSMIEQAESQVERAYAILGAAPGPGTDLLIYPVQPICGKWLVSGLNFAGRAFVEKFWFVQPIGSNHELARLKREADNWQLKYRTEYPILSLED